MTRGRPLTARPPSAASGVALVRRLWRLVGVLWLVDHVLAVPAWVMAVAALDDRLRGVTNPWWGDGELFVVTLELLEPVRWPLALTTVGTIAGWWVWSVVWRGGVVTWAVWGSAGTARVSEIVGYGVLRWWRFARLHLATTLLGASAATALGVAAATWTLRAAREGEASVLGGWVVAAAAGLVAFALLGAATAAGCWRLGSPGVRSALASLGYGLRVAMRYPLRALILVGACWTLAFVSALAPIAMAAGGGGPAVLVTVVLELGLLVRAVCSIWLLATFVSSLGIAADNLSLG